MDAELAALAGSAATTLVTSMTSDAWQRARDGIVSLWRRVSPDRAETVAGELDADREDLVAARESGDGEAEAELQREWRGRVRRLIAQRPEVAGELRALLDELAPQSAQQSTVAQHATASGQARVYQAGRDQHITER
jgi:hypothetical protein